MASIRSILIGLTINIDTKHLFLILGLCVKLDLIGFENSSKKHWNQNTLIITDSESSIKILKISQKLNLMVLKKI